MEFLKEKSEIAQSPESQSVTFTKESETKYDALFGDSPSRSEIAKPDGKPIDTKETQQAEKRFDDLFKDRESAESAEEDNTEDRLDQIIDNYIDDLKNKSDCSETIPDKPFAGSDLHKLTPEENTKMREEFDDKKAQLKKEWEEINGRPWPKYDHDIYSANGKLIRKTGSDYDAHHIQPLGMGGKNEAEEKVGLTDEEKALIKDETGWSDEIIDHIENMDQYEIYKNAGLHEGEVNGRKCLLKDIDLDYVDPKTGKTNRELMRDGKTPIDSKTGEKIELHHMGQDPDGPFAELCENSEHGDGNHGILHTKFEDSWRNNSELNNQYQTEKRNHWKVRAKEA